MYSILQSHVYRNKDAKMLLKITRDTFNLDEANLYNIEQCRSQEHNLSSASTQAELLRYVSQQFYHIWCNLKEDGTVGLVWTAYDMGESVHFIL